MAPFNEDFYGLDFGEFQAAMDYKQNKFGGGSSAYSTPEVPKFSIPDKLLPAHRWNPDLHIPPGSPLGQANVGGQPFVAPPSNERSASQYLMDLQNEQEAAYLRDNPPPVTVASLGGSPLANPGFQGAAAGPADIIHTQLGMPGPAYVPPNVGNYAARFPNSPAAQNLALANQGYHVLGYPMNPIDAMGALPAAQQPGGASMPGDEWKFRQSLVDQGHFNKWVNATTPAPHTYSPLPDWAQQEYERFLAQQLLGVPGYVQPSSYWKFR